MTKTDKVENLLKIAGFTTYNKTNFRGSRPYICYTHPNCNSYTGLIYTDQPENIIFETIFNECKKVGRIQLRQELSDAINRTNYE